MRVRVPVTGWDFLLLWALFALNFGAGLVVGLSW